MTAVFFLIRDQIRPKKKYNKNQIEFLGIIYCFYDYCINFYVVIIYLTAFFI